MPRQNSSGGKERLGSITKMGDRTIRRLLVIGAMSTTLWSRGKQNFAQSWLGRIIARKPIKLAAVALANKLARVIWAVMTRERPTARHKYRPAGPAGSWRSWCIGAEWEDDATVIDEIGTPSRPVGALSASVCYGSDPRTSSGPAAKRAASYVGRTHASRQLSRIAQTKPLHRGSHPHMQVWSEVRLIRRLYASLQPAGA
ncbi:transposase [Bradyrhizobium liaoningense]|nr:MULTISPECIES: transposase [Bradyrhizobium]MBR1003995.1 transposase [Bradyrhizobium liaoningense]WLC03684.1 transposase [Bradyrhizobium japonicum USDA 123]